MRQTDQFVFFYGSKDHFSNFYKTNFVVNGITFSCGEQYIMYSKACLFNDNEMAEVILKEHLPSKMKAWGRKVKSYDDATWCAQREDITYTGLLEKYKQNQMLCNLLMETGEREIVEASPRDRIWGIGMGENNVNVEDKTMWKGRNILGSILMRVRNQIKQEIES